MRQTAIGKSDLLGGPIAYGCWRLHGNADANASLRINTALDHGLTLIDTADIYGLGEPAGFGGAEKVLGDLLAEDKSLRGRMVLATKGGINPPYPYDSSYDYLITALEASLRRLRCETVDIYQIHRPDLMTPMQETARALNHMVASGKVRYVGVSNFTVAETRALQAHLDTPLISTQPQFSALHQTAMTDGTLDWCSETGATALAWSPLAGGAIATGRTDHPNGPQILQILDRLADVHGVERTSIALAFIRQHGASVIPIIGTQSPERIKTAARATEITLSTREFYDVIEAYRGTAMP